MFRGRWLGPPHGSWFTREPTLAMASLDGPHPRGRVLETLL